MPARMAMRATAAAAGTLAILSGAAAPQAAAMSVLRTVVPAPSARAGEAIRTGFVAPWLTNSALAPPSGLSARASSPNKPACTEPR